MMADAATGPMETFSSWWKVAALGTMAAGFAVLILLTVKAYQNAPPIPDKFIDPAGAVVFTADDVIAGQQVFGADVPAAVVTRTARACALSGFERWNGVRSDILTAGATS
jgi:hypothetical protein